MRIKFYCPALDSACPYLNKRDMSCKMPEEGLNPIDECDDAAYAYMDDEDDVDYEFLLNTDY